MTDDGFFEDYGDFDWGFDDKETSDSETDSTGQIERKFSHLSVTNGGDDEGDLACHEEDDKAFEAYEDELLAAYLRFRSFFNGSKQQLKRLTFDRYRELLDEAIRQALHARISPETDYIIWPSRSCGTGTHPPRSLSSLLPELLCGELSRSFRTNLHPC